MARARGIAINKNAESKISVLDPSYVVFATATDPNRSQDLVEFIRSKREDLLYKLQTQGVVLFRGFKVESAEQLEKIVIEALDWKPWSSFNSKQMPSFLASLSRKYFENLVGGGDYRRYINTNVARLGPVEDSIQGPHVEGGMSALRARFLALACLEPAAHLAETAVANLNQIFENLPEARQKNYSRLRNRFAYRTARKLNFIDRILLKGSPFQVVPEADGYAKLVLDSCPLVCRVPGTKDLSLQPWAFAKNTRRAVWLASLSTFNNRGTLSEDSTASAMDLNWDLCDESGHATEWTEEMQIELFQTIYENAMLVDWRKGDVLLLDNVRMAHWRMNGEQGQRKLIQIQAEPFDANLS